MTESELRLRIFELFELSEDSARAHVALTHPTYSHEVRGTENNQRLEFLGDAVLDFIASERLFERHPEADEGELTRLRARVVSTDALAEFARGHGVGAALRFGRGAQLAQLAESDNVLADAVEALLAATYLDHGLETARRVCERIVEFGLRAAPRAGARDPKSELQERVQALGLRAPVYDVVGREGPAHDTLFTVSVVTGETELGRGQGRSKRLAERAAAQAALDGGALGVLAGASEGGSL